MRVGEKKKKHTSLMTIGILTSDSKVQVGVIDPSLYKETICFVSMKSWIIN